jgi:hypothetical protein
LMASATIIWMPGIVISCLMLSSASSERARSRSRHRTGYSPRLCRGGGFGRRQAQAIRARHYATRSVGEVRSGAVEAGCCAPRNFARSITGPSTIRQPMRNSPTCLTPSSRPRAKSKSMSSLRSRRRPELGLTNPGSLSRWTGDFGPSRQQEPAERANVKH